MTDYFSGPGPEGRFKAYLAEGKFMIQRSASTGEHVFYPRTINPGTGEADLEWVEASGDGTVYATTVTRQRPEKGGDYNIALVDLAEGPRMMARVEGIAPDQVAIGMKVKAKIGESGGEPAVIFEPASANGEG
ncbi:MAG: Zn-ribbon domain-containing OB-fold protein [Alphaproteobacteria bacterium]|nr:Zn-ribbon domain-containing OB-fold protein [Alphaproteobacteria bacterium]